MKIEAREYSEDAWSTSFSLGTLAWYFVQVGAVGFISLKLSQRIGANEAQALICVIVGIIGYLAYVIAKMASVDVASANAIAEEAEARAQAAEGAIEKSERYAVAMQTLKEMVQALQKERQLLAQKMQSLEKDFQDASNRSVELSQSLESERANAKKRIDEAKANAEANATEALTTYIQARKDAEKQALAWKAKFEALNRAVEQANAEKEVQTLRASIRNRESAMSAKVWGAELLTKHEGEKARLSELEQSIL